MPRELISDAVTTLEHDCPRCGAPIEVIDRFTLCGVPEDVEHVKVRCPSATGSPCRPTGSRTLTPCRPGPPTPGHPLTLASH